MFGKFILRSFVGLVVGMLVAIMLYGEDAIRALFLMVVCTGGLSLIVIIPVAYLIGLLCTFWYLPFGKEKTPTPARRHARPAQGTALAAESKAQLVQYIEAAIRNQHDKPTILGQCLKAGWSRAEFESAYQAIQLRLPRSSGR
jgi:hypothetical protein